MSAQATLLARGARLLERVSAPAVSTYFLQVHSANGVTVRNHMQPNRERVHAAGLAVGDGIVLDNCASAESPLASDTRL